MSGVSVIGVGAMGSALVDAFAASGAEVTVWNRTRCKAEARSGPRVHVADSAAEALAASPFSIVSVSDDELARSLVDEAAVSLQGKVVACTSFATPDRARAFEDLVAAAGGHYLDLAIPAYPSEVRSGAGVFLVSGDRPAFEAHRDRLERIGRASYVDDVPSAAFISEMATRSAYLPMAVGPLQGIRICEHHDLPLEWFKETVLEFYPSQIEALLDRATKDDGPSTEDVEASVDVWGEGAAEYATALREMGLDPGMYDALHRLFDAASEAGQGHADWTCVAHHVAANEERRGR